METTVGRLLIDRALPPELRGRPGPLDNTAISEMMGNLTDRPEEYRDTVKRLMDVGRDVAYNSGGYSFGLEDIITPPEVDARRKAVQAQVDAILSDRTLKPKERNTKIVSLMETIQPELEKTTYELGRKTGNPLALQIATGTRGKPSALHGILAGEGLYTDHRGDSIPFPILRGFAEGLSPAEYFAGTFGNRKSLFDTKIGTAKSGYFSKMLSRAAHRLIVTAIDADDPDSIADRGIPVDTLDPDNDGSLLGLPAGGYPRNTPLTPAVMKDLKSKGIEKIIVRSPIASGSPSGGVYARDVGYREHGRGRLSSIAESVGMAAANAISEPVSQATLGSKHGGGVKGQGPGGFQTLEQMITSPSESPYWAGHAERDGIVTAIKPSPVGGHIIVIDDQEHWISPGLELRVKQGDRVEAGDVLSTGLANPSKLVEHKAVGEGRRAFMESFGRVLADNGVKVHRRNLELQARGLINHVEATDSFGPYLPGDIAPYDQVEHDWAPRPGSLPIRAKDARNKYLEKPVLHYTIGTRVTPSVINNLNQFGIGEVLVHSDPPPFQSTMVGGKNTLLYDPDWQTRMYGSYLEKGTLKSLWEGAESDESGSSFVPALAKGVDFGLKGQILRPGPPIEDEPPKPVSPLTLK